MSWLKDESLKLKDSCGFKIRYVKKENGGKHTAITHGAKEAKGELFWILDSDDSLLKDALFVVAKYRNHLDNFNANTDESESKSSSKLLSHHAL